MNKGILLAIVFTATGLGINAQSKKDLLAEINNLKAELETAENELVKAKKVASVSQAQAASYESQLAEVQENNATLLSNFNNFTEQSNQKLDQLSGVMETLRKKENELKFISETLTSNDSISLLVLTNFKQTMGESANIAVERGAITLIMPHSSLFGDGGKATSLNPSAEESLAKIASVLKANTQMVMTIENQTELTTSPEITYGQSETLASNFGKIQGIAPERILLRTSSNPTNTIRFRIHPDFNTFYLQLRQNMKK